MSKGGYKIFDQGGIYFVSFAVISWVDPAYAGADLLTCASPLLQNY
ncbi:MAG: hypothetical protein ABI594_19255 [Ginsengibacter sp.]